MISLKAIEPKYKVELVVERNAHFYEVTWEGGSARYPSVTGMLSIINKPALVPWAKKEALSVVEMELLKRLEGKESSSVLLDKSWIQNLLKDAKKRPDQIKDQAADLGTQAHAFIDLIIHGKEPKSVPETIEGPVQSFRDWWMKSGIELVMGDTRVASRMYGYGGSLDALGRRNGKYILIDLKTSSGCWPEYALQVAAYAQALSETYGISCDEGMILRLGKKPPFEFEVKTVADLALSLRAFLAAKTLKDALEKPQYEAF